MEQLMIKPILFPVVSIVVMFTCTIFLFMALPNAVQKKFTAQDRAGWGILILGILLAAVSYAFAVGALPHNIGSSDLSTALAMLVSPFAGLCLALGLVIAPPDKITDKILDQKNLWVMLIPILVVAALVLAS
jgi:hypothetical protein